MSENTELTFEINSDFIAHLHELIGSEGKTYEPIEHLRNALELYAKVLESMSESKIPVMVDPKNPIAEKIELPMILALFRQEIELRQNSVINLKKIL